MCGASINGTKAVSDGQWHHIAIIKSGSQLKSYVDGIADGEVPAGTFVHQNEPIYLGNFTDLNANRYFTGYLDELRISKGIARWTSNFTPPTIPYATDEYTKLLLHMQGAGNTFVDSSGTNKVVTATGNVVKTPFSPFVTEAVYETGVATGLNLGTENKFKVAAGFATDCAPAGGSTRADFRPILYNGKIYCWGGGTTSYVNTMDIYDIETNTWTTGASGGTACYGYAAALWDGKIYYYAGAISSTAYNKLEVYDIASNSWSTKTSFGTARRYPSGVAYNGKLYFFGGSPLAWGYLDKLTIYDTTTNTWESQELSLGYFPVCHQAFISENKMYVYGGVTTGGVRSTALKIFNLDTRTWEADGASSPVHTEQSYGPCLFGRKAYFWAGASSDGSSVVNTLPIYDLDANTWTTGLAGGTARRSCGQVIYGGKLIGLGGYTGSVFLNSVDIYDIETNTWNVRASLRCQGPSVVVDDKIYRIFGWNGSSNMNAVDVFDTTTNLWSSGAAGGTARRNVNTAAAVGRKIYCWGGYTTGNINNMDVYDVDTKTWSSSNVGTAARAHAVTEHSGNIYIHGGYTSGPSSALAEYTTGESPTWTYKASSNTARYNHTITAYNGKLYCWGGTTNSTSGLNSLEIYDIATNQWSYGASGGTPRWGHSAVAYNGRIYFYGGAANQTTLVNTVDIYDIALNMWTTGVAGGQLRYSPESVLIGDRMYVVGGSSNFATTAMYKTVDCYNITTNTWTLSYVESPMSNEITSITNTSPLVTITTATGQKRILGEPIVLAGYAQDVEDGNSAITSNAIWTSSIDGVLGSGDTVSYQLSEGTHTITYTATDSGGLYDSKQITMQITPAKIVVTGGKIMISNGKLVTLFSS